MATNPRRNIQARRRRQRNQIRHDSPWYKRAIFHAKLDHIREVLRQTSTMIEKNANAFSSAAAATSRFHQSLLEAENRMLRDRVEVIYGARLVRPEYPFDIGKLAD
jgi:phosphoenolpyruvate-protein kinase (PTS system EI component)